MIDFLQQDRVVFDWRSKTRCFEEFEQYAGDIFNEELITELKNKALEGCWSDDLSWLEIDDIEDILYGKLSSFYTDIKGFHGCRPVSVKSYYEKGFLTQYQESIEDSFRSIFSDVGQEKLTKAIQAMKDRGISEKGKIFFVSDEKELIEISGHYLIQGSEYLMSLAARLCDSSDHSVKDYRFRLRNYGIPTLFEVNIPVENLPDAQLTSLSMIVAAEWCNSKLFPGEKANQNLGYIAHGNISKEHIVNHSHPTEIRDPHKHYLVYRVKEITCDYCEQRCYNRDREPL